MPELRNKTDAVAALDLLVETTDRTDAVMLIKDLRRFVSNNMPPARTVVIGQDAIGLALNYLDRHDDAKQIAVAVRENLDHWDSKMSS